MTEKEYREGCDTGEPTAKEEPKEGPAEREPTPEEQRRKENQEKPITAFLVMVVDHGRIEAVVDLPQSIARKRDANVRDVRDACTALADDARTTMIANGAGEVVEMKMRRAAEQQMMKNVGIKLGGIQ